MDPRCKPWWASQIGLFFGTPAVVLFVLALLLAPARAWLLIPAIVLVALGALAALLAPPVLFRIHRWEITDEAVYARSGWLWQDWRAAPLSRVQTVDMDRGPLQRVFGLATVTVTTASARGPVRIEALDHALAEDVVQRLTRQTEQVSAGDAT